MAKSAGEVTERDVAFLGWIGKFRGVTSAQIAGWFLPDAADGERVVNRRLAVMRSLGLVTSQRVFAHHPAVHNLTRAGMNRVQVYGPVRSFSVGQGEHDLAVTELVIWLKRRLPDMQWISEREVRAIDVPSTTSPKFAVRAISGSGRKLVIPDLLTQEGRQRTAHEVENTAKDRNRMRALVLAYTLSETVDRVVYYARPKLQGRIEAGIESAREQARTRFGRELVEVSVTGWDWQEGSE